MTDNLMNCPFCGHNPTIVMIEPHGHKLAKFMPDHPGSAYIECGCGAGLIDADTDSVSKRWNTRAATSLHHELVSALESVVNNIEDYERVNNLSPSPGRTECWDSVTRAKAVLAKAKPLNLDEPRG